MPSKGEEMSATTTNLKSREPGREVQLRFAVRRTVKKADLYGRICLGLPNVLALEKNLKLFWHFRAFLCASLRLALCGVERP